MIVGGAEQAVCAADHGDRPSHSSMRNAGPRLLTCHQRPAEVDVSAAKHGAQLFRGAELSTPQQALDWQVEGPRDVARSQAAALRHVATIPAGRQAGLSVASCWPLPTTCIGGGQRAYTKSGRRNEGAQEALQRSCRAAAESHALAGLSMREQTTREQHY